MASRSRASATAKPLSWSSLQHARGSAKKVPELLAALPHPATRKAALDTLAEAFFKRGEAFTASGPLFGALVDLVATSRMDGAAELLAFALEVLAVADLPALAAMPRRRSGKPLTTALVTSAREKIPVLEKLLGDSRAPVRGLAALLLGHLAGDAHPSGAAALEARLGAEPDPATRALTLFACMYYARNAPSTTARLRPALEKLRDGKQSDALVRGAAAIALASLDGKWPAVAKSHDVLVAFFVAALPLTTPLAGDRQSTPDERFPTPGDLGRLLLDRGPASADTHLEGALASLEAMRTSTPPPDSATRFTWTVPVLDRWFPPRRGGHRAHQSKPVDVTKLKKDERAVFVALSGVIPSGGHYAHAGLPPDIRSRRRLLGLDPPSVIDEVRRSPKLAAERLPIWRLVRLAMDKYDKLDAAKAGPLFAYVKQLLDLSPAQWLDIWGEVHAGAHGGFVYDDPDPLISAFDEASKTELRAWATRLLDEIVGHSTPELPRPLGPQRDLRTDVGISAIVGLQRSGAPLLDRWDDAFTLYEQPEVLHAIFEAVPKARRLAIIESIFAFTRVVGRSFGNFDRTKVARLLDLVPEAAQVIVDASRSWKALKDDKTLFPILAAAAKKDRVVAAILKDAERDAARPKAKPKSKPKPVAKEKRPKKVTSPYRFVKGKYYGLAEAKKLKGVPLAQFLYAAERYGGGPYTAPREYFEWMGKQIGAEPEDADGAQHYVIERTDAKGKAVYEMWAFMVDNGTVFEAGTSEPTGVEMTQGGFAGTFDTPENHELADDLQEVVTF